MSHTDAQYHFQEIAPTASRHAPPVRQQACETLPWQQGRQNETVCPKTGAKGNGLPPNGGKKKNNA